MLRLDKVIKPWKESAALNDHINLYGFWNETAFLTKSGDLGMVLSVSGVDYESLDRSEQEYAVKRLEAALKAFGPGFHVYQYLFKSNRPDIPFARYDDPIVEAAIDQRRKFFEAKRDHLYQVEIFYCILLEGARSKTGVGTALARLLRDPEGAIAELKSQFTAAAFARTHLYAALPQAHAAAQKEEIAFQDLAKDEWILFARRSHPVVRDAIMDAAQRQGIAPKHAHDILTAQEAIHLVSQHVGVAIVTDPASAGPSVEGVVIRPLSDPSLSFETCLIMRADEDSRLANDFGRSFLRKCAPRRPPPMQLTLPLPA
ncbi:MAG: LysR substrate-binding domain-containing protein [Candidatus Acidiferrales bacterium]|jgi:hypothetical protein